MTAADAVLLASGTAALECMLLDRPMVVAYRLHPLSYQLVSRLLRVPYVSLPNHLLGRRQVPEYLQADVTPEKLAAARKALETQVRDLASAKDWQGLVQAMDAAGKDGTIRHVMSGVNPQGVRVSSFKAPSPEELDHDYLWRYARELPARGMIGIFNRSHYEEVLVVRVHPSILVGQKLPPRMKRKDIWQRRFREIKSSFPLLRRRPTAASRKETLRPPKSGAAT